MMEMYERIKRANENNRKSLHRVLAEYNRRAVAEMKGTPMAPRHDYDEYVMRKDGELVKVS